MDIVTDAFNDYLKESGLYQFDSAEFRWIDKAEEVWMHIHEKIKIYNKDQYIAKF